MVAEIHQLRAKPISINWMCSACGIDAGCNCGAPLMSKAQRAAEAIAADPRKSDRAIAEEIGVGSNTVRRARQTAPDGAVDNEPRVGRDGKERRMPIRHEEDEEDEFDPRLAFSQTKDAFMARAAEAEADAEYHGRVDQEIIRAAEETAAAWCQLVSKLKGEVR